MEIQLKHNNRKTVVYANRLKPYFVASKNLAVCPVSPLGATISQWCKPPFAWRLHAQPMCLVTSICIGQTSSTYPCNLHYHSLSSEHTQTHAHTFFFFIIINFFAQSCGARRKCTPCYAHLRSHSLRLIDIFHPLKSLTIHVPGCVSLATCFAKRGRDWKMKKMKMMLMMVWLSTLLTVMTHGN